MMKTKHAGGRPPGSPNKVKKEPTKRMSIPLSKVGTIQSVLNGDYIAIPKHTYNYLNRAAHPYMDIE